MIFLQPLVWAVYTFVGFPSLPVHISNSWSSTSGTSADADIEPGMSDCTSSKTVSNLQRRSSTSFVEEAVPTTKRRRKSGRLVISTMGQAARKSSVRQRQKVSCPHETVSSLRRKALAKSLKDIKICSADPIPNRPPWVS